MWTVVLERVEDGILSQPLKMQRVGQKLPEEALGKRLLRSGPDDLVLDGRAGQLWLWKLCGGSLVGVPGPFRGARDEMHRPDGGCIDEHRQRN